MSANNISEKQILSYIVSTFQYWSIVGITQDTIKHAKKNHPSSVKQMKHLLLSLTILHMFSYQINLTTYLPTKINEAEIDEIIMAYLTQCECPLLLEMENQKKDEDGKSKRQYFMGCNLQSSRVLLLLCGWVMAVSDYFNQILTKIIHPKLKLIQNPQSQLNTKAIENLIEKKLTTASQLIPIPESITTLYKSIQSRLYSTECYEKKLQKIKLKLTQQLQKTYNINIPIDSLFTSTNTLKQQKLQQQLYSIITNQIQNMGQRKYFWIWLEEKIIKQTENDIKNNHPNYSQYLQEDSLIQYNAIVDLEYLPKYIELCQYYDDKCQQLTNRLNAMKLTVKKAKQIQSQVQHQFTQILSTHNQNANHKKLFFIALQLKNHLNVKPNKKPTVNQSSNQNETQIKTNLIAKKLKKQLKNYLKSIQDAINFI